MLLYIILTTIYIRLHGILFVLIIVQTELINKTLLLRKRTQILPAFRYQGWRYALTFSGKPHFFFSYMCIYIYISYHVHTRFTHNTRLCTDEPQSYLVCNTFISLHFRSLILFFFAVFTRSHNFPSFLFISNLFISASFSQLLSMYIYISHTTRSIIFLVAVLVFYLISLLVPLNIFKFILIYTNQRKDW